MVRQIIGRLANAPLRTLDTIHLAIAERINTTALASADKVMLESAEYLGMQVVSFAP